MPHISIKAVDPESGATFILAEGNLNEEVVESDGRYFFMPDAVNQEYLQLREDQFSEGALVGADYYDVINPDSDDIVRTEVAIRADEVPDGWELIAGKYGFRAEDANGITVEVDDEDVEGGFETEPDVMREVANQ